MDKSQPPFRFVIPTFADIERLNLLLGEKRTIPEPQGFSISAAAEVPPQPMFNGKLIQNRRRQGEMFQIRFALDAMEHDYICAAPYTDEGFDLFAMPRDFARRLAEGRSAEKKQLAKIALAPVALVQVRSTNNRKIVRGGKTPYFAVTTKHGFDKKPYEEGEIDIFAAYVVPLRTWYIIPYGEVGRIGTISLFPESPKSKGRFEKFRERWDLLAL